LVPRAWHPDLAALCGNMTLGSDLLERVGCLVRQHGDRRVRWAIQQAVTRRPANCRGLSALKWAASYLDRHITEADQASDPPSTPTARSNGGDGLDIYRRIKAKEKAKQEAAELARQAEEVF